MPMFAVAFLAEALDLRNRIEAAEPRALLSRRERESLSWAALGMSNKQISDKLKLSDATVSEYLTNAAKKLGATNRARAVARAVMMDLIKP